jgi:hypothetical protein
LDGRLGRADHGRHDRRGNTSNCCREYLDWRRNWRRNWYLDWHRNWGRANRNGFDFRADGRHRSFAGRTAKG